MSRHPCLVPVPSLTQRHAATESGSSSRNCWTMSQHLCLVPVPSLTQRHAGTESGSSSRKYHTLITGSVHLYCAIIDTDARWYWVRIKLHEVMYCDNSSVQLYHILIIGSVHLYCPVPLLMHRSFLVYVCHIWTSDCLYICEVTPSDLLYLWSAPVWVPETIVMWPAYQSLSLSSEPWRRSRNVILFWCWPHRDPVTVTSWLGYYNTHYDIRGIREQRNQHAFRHISLYRKISR